MAFTVTHRAEWTDTLGVDWRVDILKDQAQAAIATLQATGEPLNIEWLTPGDSLILNPIKGSTATLNLECNTNFEYIGFYSSEDMVYKMRVYWGAGLTLYWQGWLISDYTEPYDTPPYTVSLVAADGLGMLKNIVYDNAGVHYTGRDEEDDILLNILAKIGYTQFTEFINLYEDRMDDAVTDSPCTQLFIDNAVFEDVDCYLALEEILKKYNAVIRQVDGEFVIYRPVEMVADDWYGRIITSGAVTGTHVHPDQFLQRPVLSPTSDLTDVNGGVLMMQPPIKQFTADQDYGNKKSWILNFMCEETVGASYPDNFDQWTLFGSIRPIRYESLLAGETAGMEFLPDATGTTFRAYQDFGTYAKTTANVMVFSFEYRLIKETAGAAANVVIKIQIASLTDDYWLVDDSEVAAHWDTSVNYVAHTIAAVPQGIGSWETISHNIATGLPVGGQYRITLYATDTAGVRIAWRNLRFIATSDQIITYKRKKSRIKKWLAKNFGWGIGVASAYRPDLFLDNEEVVSKTYITPDPATIEGIVVEQEYLLGDVEDTNITNVLEQYAGSLAVNIVGSLSQTATDFVNSWIGHYSALVTPAVMLSSIGNVLYFESATPGEDFIGATTIVPVGASTLDGAVVTLQANSAGQIQIDTVTITGNSGSAWIDIDGMHYLITWDSDHATTCGNFVTDHEFDYPGITVTQGVGANDDKLIFTEDNPLGGFGHPTVTNASGTLGGTVANTQASIGAMARKDQITLSGSTGTATVTCHVNAEVATMSATTQLEHTTSWHTRGNTEAQPIIELIADEIATLHNKGRQFIQLPMEEIEGNPTNFIPTYNLQDPINVTGADNKLFATNRANFDVRNRTWTVDIIEIGVK